MAQTATDRLFLIALGKVVNERRFALNLSQFKLAEAAGVSSNYVSDLENARFEPGILNLKKLASALLTDAATLIDQASARARTLAQQEGSHGTEDR